MNNKYCHELMEIRQEQLKNVNVLKRMARRYSPPVEASLGFLHNSEVVRLKLQSLRYRLIERIEETQKKFYSSSVEFNNWYENSYNKLSISKDEVSSILKTHPLDLFIHVLLLLEAGYTFYLVSEYFGDFRVLSVLSSFAVAIFMWFVAFSIKKLPKILPRTSLVFGLYLCTFLVSTALSVYFISMMRSIDSLDQFLATSQDNSLQALPVKFNNSLFSAFFIVAIIFLGAILEFLIRKPEHVRDAELIKKKCSLIDRLENEVHELKDLLSKCDSLQSVLSKLNLKSAITLYKNYMEEKWFQNRDQHMWKSQEISEVLNTDLIHRKDESFHQIAIEGVIV